MRKRGIVLFMSLMGAQKEPFNLWALHESNGKEVISPGSICTRFLPQFFLLKYRTKFWQFRISVTVIRVSENYKWIADLPLWMMSNKNIKYRLSFQVESWWTHFSLFNNGRESFKSLSVLAASNALKVLVLSLSNISFANILLAYRERVATCLMSEFGVPLFLFFPLSGCFNISEF